MIRTIEEFPLNGELIELEVEVATEEIRWLKAIHFDDHTGDIRDVRTPCPQVCLYCGDVEAALEKYLAQRPGLLEDWQQRVLADSKE